jgi:hypothetical protein
MPLLDSRRLLDGEEDGTIFSSIKDTLGDFKDSVVGLFDGVTAADVAAGTVDPSALSRADKVALAIDGKVPALFEAASPWSVGLELDPSIVAFAAVHGGIVLVISCNAGLIDTLEGAVFSPRFAFMYDDSQIAQQGVLELAFTDQTILVAQLGAPLGTRLTLWCTDPGVTFSVVKQAPASEANSIRREVFGAVGAAADGPVDAVKALFNQLFDLQKEVVIVAVIVGGIGLYFLAKGELKGLHAAGGG